MLPMRPAASVVLFAMAAVLADAAPTRRELLRSYFRSGGLTVVYAAENEANASRLAAAARRLASPRLHSVTLLEASRARPEELRGGAVALVGTPRANRWIAEAAKGLPLGVTDSGFRVQSYDYEAPSDSLALFYPCPFDPRFPLFLVTGNTDEAVLYALERRRRGDLQVRRANATLLVGLFEGGFDIASLESRVFAPVTSPAFAAPPLTYFLHDGATTPLAALAFDQASLLAKVGALSGTSCRLDPIEMHLYRNLEDKGLVTESTLAAHWEANAIHAAVGRKTEASRLLVERALETCLPKLAPTSRRGLGLALVSTNEELDELDRTAKRLLGTSSPPVLSKLDATDSPFVRDALGGSFARYLLAERGDGRDSFEATGSRLAELEGRWARKLQATPDDGSEPSFPETPSGFQHGFTFSHEGFQILNGYLSERAERSLDRLREIGVDAAALVPYAFMRDPHRVEPLSVPTRPGSETDEDVVAAIEAARERGMTVLLKPQIWLRGSWPGAIEPESREETAAFFREYRKWILHYALMAERYRVPLFAIGTELEALTRGNDETWVSIIGDIRAVYRGKLVYAANWGREVQQISFWPLLDYVGVDFYYPLSSDGDASDGALLEGIEDALTKLKALSKRHGKPVLLTEIGYASTEGPWRQPHASDRNEKVSLADQARAYDVALRALSAETSWLRGMYWWKWPSDLAVGGKDDRGFTPNGKPAVEIIRRWYGRRLQ